MAYSTKQQPINFPKRKSVFRSHACKVSDNATQILDGSIFPPESASSNARKALHCREESIVGRDYQLKVLKEFLLTHLKNQTSGSLYISGLPGTGKTASVNYIIDQNRLNEEYVIVKLNCTAFKSSKAVFKRVCEELKLKTNEKTVKDSINAVEKYLLRKHKITLLVLDEIDQLESKSQGVLYKLFEWPTWENSKFVLIGIANAVDLTDRNLPRLCASVELKPTLLHFPPYTKQQIVEILKNRLNQVSVHKLEKLFSPGAVELISAKVAGTCGDVRRALDLGKRVIEIAEQNKIGNFMHKTEPNLEIRENCLKRKLEKYSCSTYEVDCTVKEYVNQFSIPNKNESSAVCSPKKIPKCNSSSRKCLGDITPQKPNLFLPEENSLRKSPIKVKDLDNIDMEKEENAENFCEKEIFLRKSRNFEFDVDSKDVMSVVKSAFGSSKNFKPGEESSFPLHQKLLICTLLLITKADKTKNATIKRLHQVYSKICTKRGVTGVDKSGFIFLCRQVELAGVLQIGKGSGILAKISLQWDENEIANSLKDLNMLSSILNDTACLN